ncbi:MAG: hypothetical protein E7507_01325 [Ruminococcus sp.]|nr:hypothetical protein [Ruminococcus sp.]
MSHNGRQISFILKKIRDLIKEEKYQKECFEKNGLFDINDIDEFKLEIGFIQERITALEDLLNFVAECYLKGVKEDNEQAI